MDLGLIVVVVAADWHYYGISRFHVSFEASLSITLTLAAQSPRVWLVAGDFNEILDHSEKQSGLPRPVWQLRAFHLALDNAGLFDLGYSSELFTWCNRREEPSTILERLDRALGNNYRQLFFPNTKEMRLRTDLEELFQTEEIIWKQRAKSHWLKEGDRNTRFFHNYASRTFKRNSISRLKGSDGRWLEEQHDIAQHITQYFGRVFSSVEPSINYLERGVEALTCKVDSDMNSELMKPYTTEEITLGRLITDNVLIAFEINHFLKTKNWGKKGHMTLKLDIRKAYDKVEWSFLRQASLEAMECTKAGLRKSFGQEINLQKSVIVFSKNTPEHLKNPISAGFAIRMADHHEKYLGLPSVVGRSKKAVFDSVCDRIWKKISSWGEKQLSSAGKEIWIKAVVQDIPTYSMGVFRLPDGFIREIESMIAKFWWDSSDNRKIHWLSWDKLCTTKLQGDLAFGT
ncbi:UNVERIFIED_CONTAM: hypothetical protein Slati_1499500 [Sesamum latifolium]|uniref:Reverse transcriptase n=1 Tax=Sesamum latifolium TaxID=2727402 RepID=A0AAW2X929_9LAMI